MFDLNANLLVKQSRYMRARNVQFAQSGSDDSSTLPLNCMVILDKSPSFPYSFPIYKGTFVSNGFGGNFSLSTLLIYKDLYVPTTAIPRREWELHRITNCVIKRTLSMFANQFIWVVRHLRDFWFVIYRAFIGWNYIISL